MTIGKPENDFYQVLVNNCVEVTKFSVALEQKKPVFGLFHWVS
jgi:hypothetical protein